VAKPDLVRKIRDGVVDANVSLPTILREAKIMAVVLNNKELRTWIDRELGGYPEEVELPPYRRLKSPVLGNFSARFIGNLTGYQLPVSLMPETFRKMAESLSITNSVKEIEALVATATGDLRRTWPTEATLLLRDHTGVNPDFEIMEVYQPITKSQLEGVLDAVRNHLLDFVLGLQELDPNVLDSEEALSGISREDVRQVFNVTVHGDHNVLASGAGITQQVRQGVSPRDKASLLGYLKEVGVEANDLAALDEAIEADGVPVGHALGTRVKEWLGRIAAKAVEGTWKAAVAAAPTLLTKAISKYYGWEN
jgi:AbiTii